MKQPDDVRYTPLITIKNECGEEFEFEKFTGSIGFDLSLWRPGRFGEKRLNGDGQGWFASKSKFRSSEEEALAHLRNLLRSLQRKVETAIAVVDRKLKRLRSQNACNTRRRR